MLNRRIFLLCFLAMVTVGIQLTPDLSLQLDELVIKLNGLKDKLKDLKKVLTDFKTQLGPDDPIATFTQTVVTDPTQGLSSFELPLEFKKIDVTTPEKQGAFKEKLDETFNKFTEKELTPLMASVLFDTPTGDEKKKILQTSIAQAWTNSIKESLENSDTEALEQFVDGIMTYNENKCTIPVEAFTKPVSFLQGALPASQESLEKLEKILEKKDKEFKQKQLNKQAALADSTKKSLNKFSLKKPPKDFLQTLAEAYYKGRFHEMLAGKIGDLESFKLYLETQGITSAHEIITFINSISAVSLSGFIDTKSSPEKLAYLQLFLEFINDTNLIQAFTEKLKTPKSSGLLTGLAAKFWAKGEEDKLLNEVSIKKTSLETQQKNAIKSLNNKGLDQIKEYVREEQKYQNILSTLNKDKQNFIVSFEKIYTLSTTEHKEHLKEIIKQQVIYLKTATAFKVDISEIQHLNQDLQAKAINPLLFIKKSALAQADQKDFITSYNILFSNIFSFYAQYKGTKDKDFNVSFCIETAFDCFDDITKLLLFKNKNRFIGSFTYRTNLIEKIEASFRVILQNYYSNKIQTASLSPEELGSIILHADHSYLRTNFDSFKELLFNEILDLSQSLCTNITLKKGTLLTFSKEQKITLLDKLIKLFPAMSTKLENEKEIKLEENMRNQLLKWKIDLQNAIKEKDTKRVKELEADITSNESSINEIKGHSSLLTEKYKKYHFDSKQWEPTEGAFLNASTFSLQLNLQDNLEDIDRWEQAIIDNLGEKWHSFLIKYNTPREVLRALFEKLKYKPLRDEIIQSLVSSTQTNDTTSFEESIQKIALSFPAYSQHWLKITEAILTQASLTNFETMFKDFIASKKTLNLPVDYILHKLKEKELEIKVPGISQKIFDFIIGKLDPITNKRVSLDLTTLEDTIYPGSKAWFLLMKTIIDQRLGSATSGFFNSFIRENSNKEYVELRHYCGSDLFISAVVNKSFESQLSDYPFTIQDPRRKTSSTPPASPTPSPDVSDDESSDDSDWETNTE